MANCNFRFKINNHTVMLFVSKADGLYTARIISLDYGRHERVVINHRLCEVATRGAIEAMRKQMSERKPRKVQLPDGNVSYKPRWHNAAEPRYADGVYEW